jgi:predicted RNase H-related nuclease YkuK (DUF458 family)
MAQQIEDNHTETIIETMRSDDVMKLIKNFIKETGSEKEIAEEIFGAIYQLNAEDVRISPEQLLFDSELVHKTLHEIRTKIAEEAA